MTTILSTSLRSFCPTLDVANVTMSEAFELYQIMSSLSDLIDATLNGRSPAITSYLDDWQAMAFAACCDLADIVFEMRPEDERDRTTRNWLLNAIRLKSAEGPMVLTGGGDANRWADSAS